jgi:hypothetical protein
MQNIGADNAGDAFYRYKMPRLVAKVSLPPVSTDAHAMLACQDRH